MATQNEIFHKIMFREEKPLFCEVWYFSFPYISHTFLEKLSLHPCKLCYRKPKSYTFSPFTFTFLKANMCSLVKIHMGICPPQGGTYLNICLVYFAVDGS